VWLRSLLFSEADPFAHSVVQKLVQQLFIGLVKFDHVVV